MTRNSQLTHYKKTFTFDQIQKAIILKRGNLSAVANHLKISRKTIYNKINEMPDLIEVVIDAREICLDNAEQKLQDKINEGDMTAIIFYLKTQGKRRGYIERQENVDITLDLSKLSDDQLSRLAAGEEVRSILANTGASDTGTTSTQTKTIIENGQADNAT